MIGYTSLSPFLPYNCMRLSWLHRSPSPVSGSPSPFSRPLHYNKSASPRHCSPTIAHSLSSTLLPSVYSSVRPESPSSVPQSPACGSSQRQAARSAVCFLRTTACDCRQNCPSASLRSRRHRSGSPSDCPRCRRSSSGCGNRGCLGTSESRRGGLGSASCRDWQSGREARRLAARRDASESRSARRCSSSEDRPSCCGCWKDGPDYPTGRRGCWRGRKGCSQCRKDCLKYRKDCLKYRKDCLKYRKDC